MPLTDELRKAGARASAEANRLRAITAYYQQPNHCQHCGDVIHIVGKERPSWTRKKKFCDRSCAASYNNSIAIKRPRRGTCLVCNTVIKSDRKYCSNQCRTLHATVNLHTPFNSARAVVAWRQRLKLRAILYKGGRCQVCGYNRCIRALTFHHLSPAEKDFNIGGSTRAWSRIKAELDKCILLCANCHAEAHEGLVALSELAESDSNRHLSD